MLKTPIARGVAFAALGMTLAVPSLSQAAFLEDSKASLELRNFYFNRDFRQDTATKNKAAEWAQGFLMRYESGFTEGTVGFGIDAIALWGVKLDGGRGEQGTGLLPISNKGENQDDYGKVGATLKARFAKSTFRFGTLTPKLPTIMSNDSRLLPQMWRGGQVTSTDIKDLTVNVGRLSRVVARDRSSAETMTMNTSGKRITGTNTSDKFDFASFSYKWTPNLTTSYNYAKLEGNYRQNYLTLNHKLPIMEGHSFSTDLRYARSTDDGRTNVDNRAMGAMFTYQMYSHKLGLGLQKMTGDTGFAYLGDATDPYLVNYVQIGDFANADEKSWQLRYDYDFASLGIPGLTFMTRYLSGRDIDQGVSKAYGDRKGEEWERDMDLGYVFQSGALKNLGLKWRNATFRSNKTGNDIDENRVIVSYTVPLL